MFFRRHLIRALLLCVLAAAAASCKEENGVKVTSFSFKGTKAVTAGQLRSVLATSASSRLPWGQRRYFSRDQFEADLKRIVAFYRDRGFPDARVTSFDVKLNDTQTAVDITVNISEGEAILVERVTFTGFESLPVLMLTGLDDEASINRAYQAGATDFFVKSPQWSLLDGRLRYLLRSSRTRIELERRIRAQRPSGSTDWRYSDQRVILALKHRPAQAGAYGLVHFGFGLANRRQTRYHFVETCLRNDHHTILISYHDIAAGDRMATECDVKADRSWAASCRRIGGDAKAVARQSHRANARQIAHAAIGDKGHRAAVARHAEHQVAGDGATGVAARGADNHVPGLHRLESGQERQIVRWASIAGQRHAAEGGMFVDRGFDSVIECATATHRVHQKARGGTAKRIDNFFRRANHVLALNAWRFINHRPILQRRRNRPTPDWRTRPLRFVATSE